MQALSVAGVPVYAERGPRGGWILHESYRSGPRGLHADELRALFLATPGTVLGDLGLDRASESALTKLLLAAPAADRASLEQTRQRVLIDAGQVRHPRRIDEAWRALGALRGGDSKATAATSGTR
jgi:predicted DNA-binding transcriptional regulator YafY